jgi:hypothetical protein
MFQLHKDIIKSLYTKNGRYNLVDLSEESVTQLRALDRALCGKEKQTQYGIKSANTKLSRQFGAIVSYIDPKPYKNFPLDQLIGFCVLYTQLMLTNQAAKHYEVIIQINYGYLKRFLNIIYQNELRKDWLEAHSSSQEKEQEQGQQLEQKLLDSEIKFFWPKIEAVFKQTVLYSFDQNNPLTNNSKHIEFFKSMLLSDFYTKLHATPFVALDEIRKELDGLLDHTQISLCATDKKQIKDVLLKTTFADLEREVNDIYINQTKSTTAAMVSTTLRSHYLKAFLGIMGWLILFPPSSTLTGVLVLAAVVFLGLLLKKNYDTYHNSTAGRILNEEMKDYFYTLALKNHEHLWNNLSKLAQNLEAKKVVSPVATVSSTIFAFCRNKENFLKILKENKEAAVSGGATYYYEKIIALRALVPIQNANREARNKYQNQSASSSSSSASSAETTSTDPAQYAPQYLIEELPKIPHKLSKKTSTAPSLQNAAKSIPLTQAEEVKNKNSKLMPAVIPDGMLFFSNPDGKCILIAPGHQLKLFSRISAMVQSNPQIQYRFATHNEEKGLEIRKDGQGFFARLREEECVSLKITGERKEVTYENGEKKLVPVIVPDKLYNPH